MLLGWVCIGCQEAVEAKTPEWATKPVPPERCDCCGANVFQRIERTTQAEGLYPGRPAEVNVTEGNPAAFWENDGGAPRYGTGVDQDCDTTVEGIDGPGRIPMPDSTEWTIELPKLGTFLAPYYRYYTENNE